MSSSLPARLSGSTLFRVTFLLSAIFSTLALGVLGLGNGGLSSTNFDVRVLYWGGQHWLDGSSPYTAPLTADDSPLPYPPQTALLCMLLASSSLAHAELMMTTLNIICLGMLAFVCVRLAQTSEASDRPGTAPWWLISGIIIGNLSTAYVIWAGQTTLIVAAALVGGWYYARHGRWLVAGLMLAVASIKPQFSLPVVLWLLLERRWRPLAVMAVVIAGFSVVPMTTSGPLNAFLEWLSAVNQYVGWAPNATGSRMVVGVRNVFHVGGIEAPPLHAVAVVLTALIWWKRSWVLSDDVLALLISISLLFTSAHGYDLALVALLVPSFSTHLRNHTGAALVAIGLLMGITFPNSLLEPLNSQFILRMRDLLLLMGSLWLLLLSVRRASEMTEKGVGAVLCGEGTIGRGGRQATSLVDPRDWKPGHR